MKKLLSFILSILFIAGCLTGCTESTATCETLSNDVNARLDRLSTTVTKLDTISNDYLANPDIYPNSATVSYIVPNPSATNYNKNEENNGSGVISRSIATTDYIHEGTIDTDNLIQDILVDKLIDNLKCDSNGKCYICGESYGDCKNNTCNNCNNSIICDKNGACTNCNKSLQIDNMGECTNCQFSCVNGDCSNLDYNSFNNANTSCGDKYINPLEQNLSANKISTTDYIVDDEDINIDEDFLIDNEEEIDRNDIQPKLYYYYEEQNILPENTIKTRFISSDKAKTTSENINSYMIKIQKLYAMTADVIEANNKLNEQKNSVLSSINDTKNISTRYSKMDLIPATHHVQAIKNYLHDIERTTKYIKSVNGELNNEINNINNSNNLGIANSIDVINSNYLRILNHLDTRINYHQIALSTLEQLRTILIDGINNTAQDDTNTDTIIDENVSDENVVDDTNNNVINDEIIDNSTEDLYNEVLPNNTDEVIVEDTVDTENVLDGTSEDDMTADQDEADNNIESNIDTYDENLDVYDDNIDSTNNNLNIEETYTTNSDENTDNSDIIYDNESYNNNVIDNSNSGFHNNRNGIINENNLNTDGNITNTNRYVYDENGDLYNRDTNLLNNNGRHNNVNTYEYNTLIDSINQGTIDNGINNL